MAKKALKLEFPTILHVVREHDDETPYLVCFEEGIADVDDGASVAKYELVSTGKASRTTILIEDK